MASVGGLGQNSPSISPAALDHLKRSLDHNSHIFKGQSLDVIMSEENRNTIFGQLGALLLRQAISDTRSWSSNHTHEGTEKAAGIIIKKTEYTETPFNVLASYPDIPRHRLPENFPILPFNEEVHRMEELVSLNTYNEIPRIAVPRIRSQEKGQKKAIDLVKDTDSSAGSLAGTPNSTSSFLHARHPSVGSGAGTPSEVTPRPEREQLVFEEIDQVPGTV